MKTEMMVALCLALATTECVAAPAKQEHIGNLICTVGDASPKTAMICVFRNTNTGLEEIYNGSMANVGPTPGSAKRTLLWSVNAKMSVDLKPGVLAQSYEAPESAQNNAKFIEGDEKSGVSLSLITDKNEDLAALTTLRIELKLHSAPT